MWTAERADVSSLGVAPSCDDQSDAADLAGVVVKLLTASARATCRAIRLIVAACRAGLEFPSGRETPRVMAIAPLDGTRAPWRHTTCAVRKRLARRPGVKGSRVQAGRSNPSNVLGATSHATTAPQVWTGCTRLLNPATCRTPSSTRREASVSNASIAGAISQPS
jgi:hypothetical protein